MSSQKARDVILQEETVRETYELARNADLALLTCGDLTESLVVSYGIDNPSNCARFRKRARWATCSGTSWMKTAS